MFHVRVKAIKVLDLLTWALELLLILQRDDDALHGSMLVPRFIKEVHEDAALHDEHVVNDDDSLLDVFAHDAHEVYAARLLLLDKPTLRVLIKEAD